MANTRLSALTSISTPAFGDEIYINDVSDLTDNAAGSSRKITVSNLLAQADDLNTDLVTLIGTQVLTNKTLTAPTITTPTITGAVSFNADITVSGAGSQILFPDNSTSAGGLLFGADTNLYRDAADSLRTDDYLTVGSDLIVAGAAAAQALRIYIQNGKLVFSGTSAGSYDVNLYASATNVLKTDDNFIIGTAGTAAGSATTIDGTQTLTNKRITPRIVTTTDDATAVIDIDVTDQYQLTAVANATTFSTTGTPVAGQKLIIRFKDAGVAKGLTWDAVFNVVGVTLPTTTVASKTHYVGCVYNATSSEWDVLAVAVEA